ncbi:M56 family metallopeptidase [Mucilaginibacter jinjuensis]|uniref:M56 family metallopeptidase n=1 Tax=Mucilaginibacter jinjuensis TaxID=1176721 RepID=A0ABY7T1A1_9SPHI|nr:M56 family metallopeptidase [Mucilaginibacter jinjuensis]WCT10215.1 M56 family metallopeptidase [Mucilaginibacter jinjuensis]
MDLSMVKETAGYVVKALCNTLVHSLWQGLLLAAVAGLIVICTRRSSPARRYNLLIASLVLFACSVTYTLIDQLQEVQVYRTIVLIKPHQLHNNAADVRIKITTPVFPQIRMINDSKLFNYLNEHSYTIVLVWFLIVFARCLQLITGLHSLYYMRRRNIFAVDEAWETRVKELAQRLGIKQIVHIAESGMAKAPMVIGHLKPLILIPVGLMTTLSTDEIEAILVHELAHIRRRDYLVNLLVSLMEIVFFFNPAVLWISSLIKAERENCCDDIAVAQTSSKVNYIRALVSCQEYQLSAPAYAMAFSGRKNHLMGRVKRMVSNNNQSLNVMEKSLLALCLVTAGLLTTAFSNADKINKLVDNTAKVITHVSKSIKQEVTSETVTEIPDSATIKPVTTVAAEVKPVTDTAERVIPVENDTIIHIAKTPQPIDEITPIKEPIRPIDPITPITPINVKLDLKVGVDPQTLVKLNDANQKIQDANHKIKLAAVQTRLADQQAYTASKASYDADRLKSYKPYDAADYKPYDANREKSNRDKLTAELVKQGIIQMHSDLESFKLSDTEFIVNGKKMPDDVFLKFKKAFVPAPDKGKKGSWSWMYNYNTETTIQ